MMIILCVFAGLLFDYVLGEPKRFHPLVGFGWLASRLEARFNLANLVSHHVKPYSLILLGAFSWFIAVIPAVSFICAVVIFLDGQQPFSFTGGPFMIKSTGSVEFTSLCYLCFYILVNSLTLYLCIAPKSLRVHLYAVYHALQDNNIQEARRKVGFIVSRDTALLDNTGIRKAAIESTLENGSDAIFAPLFWFLLFGAPGAVFYRLSNTLDAMWGYKNCRYQHFGLFAARVDDVLNFIPSRLVALSYSLLGNRFLAFKSWRLQAKLCASPNAGTVMTAGAGALELQLGGDAFYHGKLQQRCQMGFGRTPENHDLLRCITLVDKTLFLWLSTLVTVGTLIFAPVYVKGVF